jgi:hypothetical protein
MSEIIKGVRYTKTRRTSYKDDPSGFSNDIHAEWDLQDYMTLKMWAANLPIEMIADVVGRSPAAVERSLRAWIGNRGNPRNLKPKNGEKK